MGTRGPGSYLKLAERADLALVEYREPWADAGLTRVQRVLRFLEFLPITKGKLEGSRMRLLPDQVEFVRAVYGSPGGEPIRLAVRSAPRGSGKTGLVAGLVLCHLLGPESEPRGEVYSAAIDRLQAALVFNEIEAIIRAVPQFLVLANVQRHYKKIEVLNGPAAGSIYEALSSDARRAHGLSPSLWVYDELAQAKDRTLLDNLTTAMGKRKSSLGIVISTQAADNDHPLSQLIDDGLTGIDRSMVVHLTAAPVDDDPFSEATIRACNPAAGVFLDLQDIIREAERARRIPAFEPAYRNLRLNQRVDTNVEARIVRRDVWDACPPRVAVDALAGRKCYGALDLSGKHDLTSLTLVFPDDDVPETGYDVLQYFWTPSGAMEARSVAEKQLFSRWISEGLITATPGPTIRYGYMAAEIGRLRERYDIRTIAYDAWRVDDFIADLEAEGISDLPLEKFIQGFKSMGPAIEFFAELALTGRLRHGGNEVLTRCVANAITITDPSGNLKIDKQKSNRTGMTRIDGAVTLCMALGIAKRLQGEVAFDVSTMIGFA